MPSENDHRFPEDGLLKPLFTESQIRERVVGLVQEIAHDMHGDCLIVVGLLKGSFVFLADLVRLLHRQGIPLVIDFLSVSSYGTGTESSGSIRLERDITIELKNRNILLVDDILDTGRTLHFVQEHLMAHKPNSMKTCVLLNKPARRVVTVKTDYVGFTVPDAFLVGYGLDLNHRYRELPYISIFPDKDTP
jgi:hypoxanthine phosphoribosyltransferase